MSDMKKIQDILTKLTGFDTTSSHPNRGCIDYISDYLKDCGVACEIIASAETGKACLWATLTPTDAVCAAKPGIVLAGHSDTVPVAGQDWSSDPFTLTERDGKFFARGACDMKGFIACVLSVVPELLKGRLTQPVHLAFTHDEETTMAGAQNLTDVLRQRQIAPQWVWIGEPTELRIIDSHKGVAMFRTDITGVPGHSGQPAKGLNAIDLGAEFIQILRAMAQLKSDRAFVPSRFDPPYTSFNIGTIKGGTAENIIAEHCEIQWQARAHPGDNLGATVQQIDELAQDRFAGRFQTFAPRAGLRTCTCFDIPPLLPTVCNPGAALLGKLTGHSKTEAVSFATEAGFFQKLGTHVVVCGPGSIDQAHKADEFIEKSQLASCVDLLRQVLLCSDPA
jgi:acetylornithine deacetylase